MNIVSLKDVAKSVGAGPLFEGVTFGIAHGEKIGLVGRNGSGKSTLIGLLTGDLEPDAGSIARRGDLVMASLEQQPRFPSGVTVRDYGPGDEDHIRLAAATRRYEAFCSQLGMYETGLALDTLSGGMQKKVAIARCLAADADLMTLDEPTNHLDLDAVLWLEQLLGATTSGFVMVTHDRRMLDAVCTTILEIADRTVYRHVGDYSAYLRRRAERHNEQDAAERRRVSILRRELEWLQRGPKARTGKDKGRQDRIDELLQGGAEANAVIGSLPAARRRQGRRVLELSDVAKSYDRVPVISGFSYEFSPGQRVGVIGPNGSGKTTLLDIIAGRVVADRGSVEAGETTAFAYFDQTGASIDAGQTVLDYLKTEAERVRINGSHTVSAEQFLERFLFPRAMFSQTLDRLSGGEFRRLQLVRTLATAPNFLLLDEPTNDLDLETIRVLEQYLDDFSGCLLLVSHDRALLSRVTDSLLVFDGSGGIRPFVGSYDDYRAEQAGPRQTGDRTSNDRPGASGRSPRKRDRTGLSYREREEYESLPDAVAELEEELRRLEELFQAPVDDPAKLEAATRRYGALQAEVEEKISRWEELGERAE